jgi:uncharacterized membrane protein YfcA
LPELSQLLIFLLFGLLSGIIGGFLGVGGGTVYVPVLTAYYAAYAGYGSEFVVFVIGNSLFLTMISGLSGSWKQLRINNFYVKDTLRVGIAGASTALLTSMLLPQLSWYKKEQFALFFTLLLLPLMLRLLLGKTPVGSGEPQRGDKTKLILVGALSGIVSALSGLGGGVIMVPLLADVLKYPVKKASSISLGAIALMALSTVTYYSFQLPAWRVSDWQIGLLALPAILPMALGVLLSAPYGVRLAQIVAPRTMKLIFVLFFIVVILQMNFSIFG